ncbi:hypothetical protein A0H81_10770 [Grifola frondosa]|uniref:F-box domain-containing protein n=1 Tax=Grifola frondosa TaxID=5627 RepID=A0A1C7LX78_GRIFR|nr:hypothetical protein A0H81_10770 [Grifola frondosa]
MFSSSTPCLTTLKLIYSYPALGRVSFASLKELYIRGKKRDLITMEISQLLQMLEACPRLEVLVTYKTTFVPSEGEYEFRQIRLDSLRWIDIARCSATVVTDMISRLIVPNCTLRLSVWLERRDDFRFLFGVPYDLEETHPLRDIRRLHITYQSASGAIVLEGNTSLNPFQITATIGSGSNIGDMPTVSGPLLQSVTKTLDLSLLEEFAVAETAFYQPHTGFSRDTWRHVLEKMPMLKVLHVRLQSITDGGFCRALLSALSTPEGSRAGCPAHT